MLKPQTEPSQLLKRLECLLTVSKNCKAKSESQNKWNSSIHSLISDSCIQNLTKDLSKLSNNYSKLNMVVVSI